MRLLTQCITNAGADPGFQVRGAYLKKLRRAEGGANIFGVFRVKNHDFTPKNHIGFAPAIRKLRFEIVNIEVMQQVFVIKHYFGLKFKDKGQTIIPLISIISICVHYTNS